MKGKETWPCGCKLDHDKKVIDPCENHVEEILHALARDNGGKICFERNDGK